MSSYRPKFIKYYLIHGSLKLVEILPAIGQKHLSEILNFACVEFSHQHGSFRTQPHDVKNKFKLLNLKTFEKYENLNKF